MLFNVECEILFLRTTTKLFDTESGNFDLHDVVLHLISLLVKLSNCLRNFNTSLSELLPACLCSILLKKFSTMLSASQ
eukprot:TRINITY_DN1017_c0_g1_i1.p3 TRINITY_DN1017_c0_g1~~TRINITY_DN1017_c0_g1_i1.p3  ORF type:complete len:78 (-),score=2.55 TRINITY_DN1017_c0_g1_i1:374-607(-)